VDRNDQRKQKAGGQAVQHVMLRAPNLVSIKTWGQLEATRQTWDLESSASMSFLTSLVAEAGHLIIVLTLTIMITSRIHLYLQQH